MTTAGLTIVALLLPVAGARADEHTFVRGIDEACTPPMQQLDVFEDVDPDATHAGAIDCLVRWGIVRGLQAEPGPDQPRIYDPGEEVSRAAMGSFLARTLMQLPEVDVPPPSQDRFPDYATTTHADNVHILRAAGIVQGRMDGTYGPGEPVNRAQMATFVTRMIEFVTDEQLPVGDAFDPAFPDTGGVHESNIDKLATLGVVAGRTDGTYGPGEPVSRAAMASFVTRLMDHLADLGFLPVGSELELMPRADEVPANLNNRIDGRVLDQFGSGYPDAEIRFEVFRDDALVLAGQRVSQAGGETLFSYNADAQAGDTDVVVACLLEPDTSPPDTAAHCAEEVDDRRAAEATVTWGDPQPPDDDPAGSDFLGEAIDVDTTNDRLEVQLLPPDDGLGGFFVISYSPEEEVEEFEVDDESVDRPGFECAVGLTVGDSGADQRLTISMTSIDRMRFVLSTSTDVGTCLDDASRTPAGEEDSPLGVVTGRAVQLAAEDAGVDPSEVEVVRAEEVTWRSGAIGCPQPGEVYTQALVEGFRVVVEVEGERIHYHADDPQEPFRCDDPEEPLETS